MATKNVNIGDGGAASAPWLKGDGTTGQTRRRLALGATGARFDIHTHTASPEGVVTVAADAVGALCVVVSGGDTELWAFEGTPGQNTGWAQLGTGGGGGGATDFTDLGDVPSAYAGAAAYLLAVTGAEDGVEFVDGSTLFDALGAAAAVASDLATHEADYAHDDYEAQKLIPSATVHTAGFALTAGVVERWDLREVIAATMPNPSALRNGARVGLCGVALGQGGRLTLTCTGGATFLGVSSSLGYDATEAALACQEHVFRLDKTLNQWIVEGDYLSSFAPTVTAPRVIVTQEESGGVRRLAAPLIGEGQALARVVGEANLRGVDFADMYADDTSLARWRDTTVAVHWALNSGNDANDGSSGNPVQTAARAKELADGFLRYGVNVVVTLDEVAAGGAKYVLWDAVVLGEGDCRLEFVAAASTYLTVAGGPYTVASRVQHHSTVRLTVSGAAWTENEHRGRWIRPLIGTHAGKLMKVFSNTTGTMDIGGTLVLAASDTFEIMEPGVLVEGPGTGGAWQPHAPGLDPAFAVSHPRLRVHGLVFTTSVSVSGAVALPFCRVATGNVNVRPGSSVTFYDHATGLYTGVDIAAGRLLVGTGAQCRYGHVTCRNPPNVYAGGALYLDSLSYAGATTFGSIFGECHLGAWYGRGAGTVRVELGGRFLWDSSTGRPSLCDVQTTGAVSLYIFRGGHVVLNQNGSTATSWPILLQLASGYAIIIEEGGTLWAREGRFWQGIGRGTGAYDIIVGSLQSFQNTTFWDGVDTTKPVLIRSGSATLDAIGYQSSGVVEFDETSALDEATPLIGDYVRSMAGLTGVLTKTTWSTVLALASGMYDALGAGAAAGAAAVVSAASAAAALYAPLTRNLTAGSGLTGGGTLASDRTFAVDFGTGAGEVCEGNDARLSDARAITVRKNSGADVGTRARLNLIEGSGVSLTVADDAGDGEVDVTIAAAAGGVSDGDKGDITVSGSGAAWAIDAGAVTLAKQADLAADTIQGRANGAGTGVPQALTAAQVRTILNVENGAAADQSAAEVPFTPAGDIAATDVQAAIVEVRDDTDTKLAAKAASSHTHATGDVAGVTTDRLLGRDTAGTGVAEELTVGGGVEFTGSGGIQRSALTGDVTASAGSGSTAIANNAVTTAKILDANITLAKMADLAQSRVIGRAASAGTGVPTALTPTEVWTLLGALVANLDVAGFALLNLQRARTNTTAVTSTAGNATIDLTAGGNFRFPLTENTVLAINGCTGDGQKGTILFVQDGTPRTLGLPTDADAGGTPVPLRWLGGAPTMPTGSGDILLVAYDWNGTEFVLSSGVE
jgi:hypothetical protein